MNATRRDIDVLVRRACEGDGRALGELLEEHRDYLKVLARRYLQGGIGVRLDDSDLVQQTCLSVHRNIEKFKGSGAEEFLAWLRRIHEQNLQNALRDHTYAQKRAVGRERSDSGDGQSPDVLPDLDLTSPSQRVLQGEEAVRLAKALERLPEQTREAVRLRHVEGWTLKGIAEHLGCSRDVATGLINRGLRQLKGDLSESGH